MERILNKITSARWLIAVIMTLVFAVLAIKNNLSTEFITIYTMVIAFYFSKDRRAVVIITFSFYKNFRR